MDVDWVIISISSLSIALSLILICQLLYPLFLNLPPEEEDRDETKKDTNTSISMNNSNIRSPSTFYSSLGCRESEYYRFSSSEDRLTPSPGLPEDLSQQQNISNMPAMKATLSPITLIIVALAFSDFMCSAKTLSAQAFNYFDFDVLAGSWVCNIEGFVGQLTAFTSATYAFVIGLILHSAVYNTEKSVFLNKGAAAKGAFKILHLATWTLGLSLSFYPTYMNQMEPLSDIGCWIKEKKEGTYLNYYRLTFYGPLVLYVIFVCYLSFLLICRPKSSDDYGDDNDAAETTIETSLLDDTIDEARKSEAKTQRRKGRTFILLRMKIFVNLFLLRWCLFLLTALLYDSLGMFAWVGDVLGDWLICCGGVVTFAVWSGVLERLVDCFKKRKSHHREEILSENLRPSSDTPKKHLKNDSTSSNDSEADSPTSIMFSPHLPARKNTSQDSIEARAFFDLPESEEMTNPGVATPESTDTHGGIYRSSELWVKEKKREELLEKAKNENFSLLSDESESVWERV